MKWFKHDSAASMDAKLRKLMAKYGLQGYGLYWFCLELVAFNVDANNLTFELEHDADLISRQVQIHADLVQEMMQYMIDLGLFENNNGIITCLKLSMRTDEYTQKLLSNNKSNRDKVPIVSGQSHERVGTKSVLLEENRREEKRRETMSSKLDEPALSVLNHLNEKTGRKYRPVPANMRLIQARLKEGASPEDCIRVIDTKALEWKGNTKMEKYLRPATLFNAEKFSQYVAESGTTKPQNEFAKIDYRYGIKPDGSI